MTVRACQLCQFYVPLGSIATRGSCVRFPTPMMKNDGDWCGEFAGRAVAAAAESSSGVKSKGGLRIKETARDTGGTP